jgi:hypothetical protein
MAEENSTSTELPETIGIHEAAELMTKMGMGLDDTVAPNAQPEGNAVAPEAAPAENVSEDAPDGGAEEDPDGLEAAEGDGQGEDPTLNEAPEFWSAEDKAAWNSVPPALRPMLKKIDSERVAFVNQQKAEAAKIRQEALEEVKQATSVVEQGAKWWTDNGPQFFKAFGDKWAQVNWVELAESDPARCQAMREQQRAEGDLLRQAHERAQRDIETANKNAEARFQEVRRTEHEKVAKAHPEYFGTRETAEKTYKELSQFLFDRGIPATVIEKIHEAPIIEMALESMLYRKAKKQASSVAKPGAANTPAARTPLRVAPGPGSQPANRVGERARQASERIRSGRSIDSIEEAAALANSLRL